MSTAVNAYGFGEVIRQTRICTEQGNTAEKHGWLRTLNDEARDVVANLERHRPRLMKALDLLIPFPGLWRPLDIRALENLRDRRYLEEITHYIYVISSTWSEIVSFERGDPAIVDDDSVQLLQGRCPGLSQKDEDDVCNFMNNRKIFAAVWDSNQRMKIHQNIRLIPRTILSLDTLFIHCRCMDPCFAILQELLPSDDGKTTLFESFAAQHDGRTSVFQISEDRLETRPGLSSSFVRWSSYCQLLLYISRKLVGQYLLPRQTVDLAALASMFGYQGLVQKYQDRETSDIIMIKECIQKYCMSQIDPELQIQLTRGIVETLSQLPCSSELWLHGQAATPSASLDGRAMRISTKPPKAQRFTSGYIFFDYMCTSLYRNLAEDQEFMTQRDLFYAFFGASDEGETVGQPHQISTLPSFEPLYPAPERTGHTDLPLPSTDSFPSGSSQAMSNSFADSDSKAHQGESANKDDDGEDGSLLHKAPRSWSLKARFLTPPTSQVRDLDMVHKPVESAQHDFSVVINAIERYDVINGGKKKYKVIFTDGAPPIAPLWRAVDPPPIKSVDYEGQVYASKDYVMVLQEGGKEGELEEAIVRLQEIRDLWGQIIMLVSWCYPWQEIPSNTCMNLWPPSASYILTTHMQVLHWSMVNGKVNREGRRDLASGLLLDLGVSPWKIRKVGSQSRNWLK